ncbi:MAG: preprotein translocase subunit SecE [Micromonosporaceae bacterium]
MDSAAEDLDDEDLDADELDDADLDAADLDEEDDEEDARPARRRTGTAVKRAKAESDAETKSKTRPDKGKTDKAEKTKRPARVGPIGRLIRFIREVVAELRKVIWPTRKELLTYTVVVVVFVVVMLGIIALYDLGFARAMLWVFGSKSAGTTE